MKKTSRILIFLLMSMLVIISGCIGNTPSSTGTSPTTSENPTSNRGETSEIEISPTETGSETGTETHTEAATQTETQTETSTETPVQNESLQYDEDGNVVCEGDADPDLGCEAGETNENGSGPGFSLAGGINFTLQPVIRPVYMLTMNFTYVGPIGSEVFEPNGEKIEQISIITQSTNPGKNVKFTITFENESLAAAYVHIPSFIDMFSGKKHVYEPTVIKFDEGDEFGRNWELHLYSTGSTLYELTSNGSIELQSGEVELDGRRVSFTVENFSEIFPEKVYLRIYGRTINDDNPSLTYPSVGKFVVEAGRGWIDYYSPAWFGLPDENVELYMEAGGHDLLMRLYFKDERTYNLMMPIKAFIDSSDNGEADWIAIITANGYELKDRSGSVFRSGDVKVEQLGDGRFIVEFNISNFFSLVPWRYFRLWFAPSIGLDRFPSHSNIWVNATNGLSLDKDVERYLIIVVEDVYIKGNKDSAEGEIQLVSWAFPVYWEHENDLDWEYGPIYAVGYPAKRWVEANDHSRLLYHDERAISVSYPFINGYPIFVMPLDEVKKYRKVYVQTAGWDLDDPGEYITLGVGLLIDAAIGLATGEIGTAMKYGYNGVMFINQLVTGQGAGEWWGSTIVKDLGGDPDPVGYNGYTIDARGNYRDGVLVEIWSADGNMRVTYLVQEVEVPRTLRYDTLKAYLDTVQFTKDTELGDDEYYLYASAFTHFEPQEYADVPDITREETTAMVPVEVTYRYPKAGVLSGNKVTARPEMLIIEHARANVPLLYLEYAGWEEDAGKWGNDDDPMGQVAITILLDDDYFNWDSFSGIPEKEWSIEFPSCGVSGGCSKAWFWVRINAD
ncbi:hypothetical protein APY94_05835 [Thermococcus celericrescens]|uniref:Uncharacterized protein n=1 Tax=Thermococcus celericrescens TaxID=227598 RepID=A0A124EBC9_9EURY|nr:hypothetical protein [Thermococcus celericrescens]KUH33484.1 hypothetical protein APY94_05835 [Thermococcus celericrescens]